jgi:hypothetical protein
MVYNSGKTNTINPKLIKYTCLLPSDTNVPDKDIGPGIMTKPQIIIKIREHQEHLI